MKFFFLLFASILTPWRFQKQFFWIVFLWKAMENQPCEYAVMTFAGLQSRQ